MTDLRVRPKSERNSVHPSISADQISDLVDRFYDRVLSNRRLGPIFSQQLDKDWDTHLIKMKAFWRSVLLRTGEYTGRPVPIHNRLEGIGIADFEEWLGLFAQTSSEVFSEEAAEIANESAQKIANSLWMSRSSDPFAASPKLPQPACPAVAPTHHTKITREES